MTKSKKSANRVIVGLEREKFIQVGKPYYKLEKPENLKK